MFKAILLSSALVTGAAIAHDHCHYDIDFDIKLGEQQVVLGKKEATFTLEDGRLWRNGTELKLNAEQRALVRDYESHSRALVPQVLEVTLEGLSIGAEAAVGAFTVLLGEEHESIPTMKRKFANLETELKKRMNAQHLPRRALSIQKDDYNFLDEGASLGLTMMGAGFSVLGKVIQASVDEEFERQWEKDLHDFEQEFESRIEARADALETKADAMCETLKQMNTLEQKLSVSHDVLQDFDIVKGRKGPCNDA